MYRVTSLTDRQTFLQTSRVTSLTSGGPASRKGRTEGPSKCQAMHRREAASLGSLGSPIPKAAGRGLQMVTLYVCNYQKLTVKDVT